jgi:hypothetical protein
MWRNGPELCNPSYNPILELILYSIIITKKFIRNEF